MFFGFFVVDSSSFACSFLRYKHGVGKFLVVGLFFEFFSVFPVLVLAPHLDSWVGLKWFSEIVSVIWFVYGCFPLIYNRFWIWFLRFVRFLSILFEFFSCAPFFALRSNLVVFCQSKGTSCLVLIRVVFPFNRLLLEILGLILLCGFSVLRSQFLTDLVSESAVYCQYG